MYYGVIIIMSKQSFLFAGRRNRSVLQFMKTFLLKFLLSITYRISRKSSRPLIFPASFIVSWREFFMKNKARVIKTSLYEYDAKRQRKFDREEGRIEGREEGRIEGREEGRIEGLREGRVKDRIIIIQRKIKRGKSLDVIADELETTIDEIEPLYNVVIKYSTDTDPEEILKEVIIKG